MELEIIFVCQYAKDPATGATLWHSQRDDNTGRVEKYRICDNEKSWTAMAKTVEFDENRLEVHRGGYCKKCGNMGQAIVPDEHKSKTVFVYA